MSLNLTKEKAESIIVNLVDHLINDKWSVDELLKVYNTDIEVVKHVLTNIKSNSHLLTNKSNKLADKIIKLVDASHSQPIILDNRLKKYSDKNDALLMPDNARILIISDQHSPYHHPDIFAFLRAVKKKYKPTRTINIGDEVDFHNISFHDSDPDLLSAGDELRKSYEFIQELHSIFPEMDLLESNHGSLAMRKGKHHNLPSSIFKSYNDIWGVGKGWRWYTKIETVLPNGQKVEFRHQGKQNVLQVSKELGKSYVQGHHHTQFEIRYWSTCDELRFAMSVGSLIDDESLAFAYNKISPIRPIIGLGMIINSLPMLIPMVLNKNGRWTGELV